MASAMAESRSAKSRMRETALYAPIKKFLKARGYEVKAEIGPADVGRELLDTGPMPGILFDQREPELFDAPGTECELTLLPDGQAPLTARGRVVAAQPEVPGRRPAGLEVQLTEMSDGTRLWLDLFARQRAAT